MLVILTGAEIAKQWESSMIHSIHLMLNLPVSTKTTLRKFWTMILLCRTSGVTTVAVMATFHKESTVRNETMKMMRTSQETPPSVDLDL